MILKVVYSARVFKRGCFGFLREVYYSQKANEEKYEETLQTLIHIRIPKLWLNNVNMPYRLMGSS